MSLALVPLHLAVRHFVATSETLHSGEDVDGGSGGGILPFDLMDTSISCKRGASHPIEALIYSSPPAKHTNQHSATFQKVYETPNGP